MPLARIAPRVQNSSSVARRLSLLMLLLALSAERSAFAAGGPGCDAGPCADNDGDGFINCACSPPGQTCDCDDDDPKAYPGAPEACNAGKDLACNGPGIGDDAGSKCVFGYGCLGDLCVPRCRPLDDFGCDNDSSCIRTPDTNERLCKPVDCTSFGCPPGFTCDDAKRCVPNCPPEVKCPYGQRCRGFACVDACAGVNCALGAICKEGRCVPSCGCLGGGAPCAPNETCDLDAAVPSCLETACIGVTCPEGQHCTGGECVEDCKDVVCPPERLCRVVGPPDGGRARGECVDLCNPDPCNAPDTCEWRDGGCTPPSVDEGGLVSLTNTRPRGDIDFVGGGGGGASCSNTPTSTTSAVIGGSALSFLAFFLRSRRRR